MAGGGLIALLDDIALVMDRVAETAKIGVKAAGAAAGSAGEKGVAALTKAGAVVGDDVAVGAEKLRIKQHEELVGLMAKREWPIVAKVAWGSAKNKVWLTAGAMALSAAAPWSLPWILLAGGLYLSKEGAEKVIHEVKARFGKHAAADEEFEDRNNDGMPDDPVTWENEKIKSAVRTDMVLSGEIILVTLGMVAGAPLIAQAMTVAGVGAVLTVGVYGAVAALVKLDDAGLALASWARRTGNQKMERVGEGLLTAMPHIMRGMTFLGTAAMLAVGGDILAGGVGTLGHAAHSAGSIPGIAGWIAEKAVLIGGALVAGAGVEAAISGVKLLTGRQEGGDGIKGKQIETAPVEPESAPPTETAETAPTAKPAAGEQKTNISKSQPPFFRAPTGLKSTLPPTVSDVNQDAKEEQSAWIPTRQPGVKLRGGEEEPGKRPNENTVDAQRRKSSPPGKL